MYVDEHQCLQLIVPEGREGNRWTVYGIDGEGAENEKYWIGTATRTQSDKRDAIVERNDAPEKHHVVIRDGCITWNDSKHRWSKLKYSYAQVQLIGHMSARRPPFLTFVAYLVSLAMQSTWAACGRILSFGLRARVTS